MISVSKRMLDAQETLQAVPRPESKDEVVSPKIKIVERIAPLDMRFFAWVDYQIRTPRRLMRLIGYIFRWNVGLYSKARLLLSAVTGPKIAKERYDERQAACKICPQRDEGGYCRSCGCGRWPLARLDRKNWYERWSCPQRRHTGTYVQYTWPGRKQGCGGAKRREAVDVGHSGNRLNPRQQ